MQSYFFSACSTPLYMVLVLPHTVLYWIVQQRARDKVPSRARVKAKHKSLLSKATGRVINKVLPRVRCRAKDKVLLKVQGRVQCRAAVKAQIRVPGRVMPRLEGRIQYLRSSAALLKYQSVSKCLECLVLALQLPCRRLDLKSGRIPTPRRCTQILPLYLLLGRSLVLCKLRQKLKVSIYYCFSVSNVASWYGEPHKKVLITCVNIKIFSLLLCSVLFNL